MGAIISNTQIYVLLGVELSVEVCAVIKRYASLSLSIEKKRRLTMYYYSIILSPAESIIHFKNQLVTFCMNFSRLKKLTAAVESVMLSRAASVQVLTSSAAATGPSSD